MASIPALQQALDCVLDAEPWDPVAVERARTKLDIAVKRARDEARADHEEEIFLRNEEAERTLRQARAAHEEEIFLLRKAREEAERTLHKARASHEEEIFLLRKAHEEPSATKVPRQARSRERTPPPATLRSASPALGLEADLPHPAVSVGVQLTAPIEDSMLLSRLLASFRADLAQQSGTVTGINKNHVLFVCLFVSVFVCLFICLFVYLFVCLFVCLSPPHHHHPPRATISRVSNVFQMVK
jgi:hypothetical protein